MRTSHDEVVRQLEAMEAEARGHTNLDQQLAAMQEALARLDALIVAQGQELRALRPPRQPPE
jgi:hypothetical protein